jgi:phosphatidylinositol-bisphosphatase
VHLTFTPPVDTSEKTVSPVNSAGPTTMTFVNSHLAAFDEMVDRRNSDFQDLSKRLMFEGTRTARPRASESEDSILDRVPPSTSVYESDVLFWMVSHLVLLVLRDVS